MTELEKLMQDIDELRNRLHQLLEDKKQDTSDPEIIAASEILNAAILKYSELLRKKKQP